MPFTFIYGHLSLPSRLFNGAKYLWRRYHVQSEASTATSSDQTKSVPTESVTPPNVFVRVFGRFALLWAIIAVNTQFKVLAIIGILAALFGALRASYNLWDFISDSIDWIGSLEGPFSRRLAEAIKAIRESDQPEHAQKIKNAANLLKMAEKVCNFLADQKRILAKVTRIIAFFITIPLYVYISSIFAAVYFGIAKLEHLTLDWRSALIDSLFVPIAFTDLPHSFAIRLIAGIHAVVIGAIGCNVLFRHFNSKITQLSATALELGRPFQDRELMTQIDLYADKIELKPKTVASESVPVRQDQGVA
jgi:hypothetical protein